VSVSPYAPSRAEYGSDVRSPVCISSDCQQKNYTHFLEPQYNQSRRLWKLLKFHKSSELSTKQDLLHLTFILEEQIQNIIAINSIRNPGQKNIPVNSNQYESIINFYTQPEIPLKRHQTLTASFLQQILNPPTTSAPLPTNQFSAFNLLDQNMPMMKIDSNTDSLQSSPTDPSLSKPVWSNDTSVLELTDKLFSHLKEHQEIANEAGDLKEDAPTYENPTAIIQPPPNMSQRIQFNLICHRGTVCDVPTGKLFKSFLTTMQNADSSLIVLPFQAAKQHYSSLANLKQIQNIDDTKLLQFFKPYYHKQQYSLSGYFHISSTLAFDELCSIPQVEEWLNTYNYSIKLCPSQTEEMTKIGTSVTATFLCIASI
jgi:hypothetical protein